METEQHWFVTFRVDTPRGPEVRKAGTMGPATVDQLGALMAEHGLMLLAAKRDDSFARVRAYVAGRKGK